MAKRPCRARIRLPAEPGIGSLWATGPSPGPVSAVPPNAPQRCGVGESGHERKGEGLVLELQFVVDVPRERIFRTLTEHAELARWWGPHGYTTPEIDLDLRVGGGYRFTMQPPDGDRFHLAGEFLESEPPSRLVYTFRWEEPDPDDRETVVTIGQECRPHTFR